MLANFSNKPLVVPKATVFGIAEEISEPLVDSINAGCKSDADSPTKPRRRKKSEVLYNKLLKVNRLTILKSGSLKQSAKSRRNVPRNQ
jgi:hypothetical protein